MVGDEGAFSLVVSLASATDVFAEDEGGSGLSVSVDVDVVVGTDLSPRDILVERKLESRNERLLQSVRKRVGEGDNQNRRLPFRSQSKSDCDRICDGNDIIFVFLRPHECRRIWILST